MKRAGSNRSYVRASSVVWRDTGDHVVAKRLGAGADCVLIGGGAAQVWRLLDQPRGARQILEELLGRQVYRDSAVDERAVRQVLADLAAHRLVSTWAADDV